MNGQKLKLGFVACALLIFAFASPLFAQYRPDLSSLEAMPGPSLWPELRRNMRIHYNPRQPEIQQQIRWFQRNQRYFYRTMVQSAPYLSYIYSVTAMRKMPAELALIPFIESEYNPFAYSHAGAAGLWQFMPGTASGLKIPIDWWYDGRRDVQTSTYAALDYLSYLNNSFDNHWLLAVAAYDSGEGTVASALRYNQKLGRHTNFWHLKLPHETALYIPKFLALVEIIKHPSKYNFRLPYVSAASYFQIVSLTKQLQLGKIAQLAEVDLETLTCLNPGFRRRATGPDIPIDLLLPTGHAEVFRHNLAALKEDEAIAWHHHRVKPGETLSNIALDYHTNCRLLRAANNLSDDTIYPFQHIIVPASDNIAIMPPIEASHQKRMAADHSPGQHRYEHHVISGDSYNKLAQKYGVKPNEIRFWNNHTARHKLNIGETLTIWSKKRIKYTGWEIYTVQSGDALLKIAKRFKTNVDTLKTANKLQSNVIRVGQQLKVPVSYT